MAGTHKGKWSWVMKNDPDYFGRSGFKIPVERKNRYSSINVGILEEFLPQLFEEGIASKEGKEIILDLTKTDYSKVLGKGKVSNALSVKAEAFSARAVEKIEEAGGKALSVLDEAD